MPQQYYFANHIHACCTGRYYIFLDLSRDRYFSIPKSALLPLTPHIHGWNISTLPPRSAGETIAPESSDLAEFLLRQNVLRADSVGGKAATQPVVPVAATDARAILDTDNQRSSCSPAPFRVLRCLCHAQFQLKVYPLRRVIASVARRKAAGSRALSASQSTVLSLTASFARYRPYFPHNIVCLLDSLALIHFLADHGVYPEWVFGVREDPFYAHCWVQAGTVTLNDFHDRIVTYTPILAI